MCKVEITVEKTVRVCKEFEVTEEQLEELRAGINPFFKEFENDLKPEPIWIVEKELPPIQVEGKKEGWLKIWKKNKCLLEMISGLI